ncbi:MAG: Uma2 family endonuclease [Acidobacteria bacterium]|nr:Uma2 family endonuclease [Acidobacteriota bacterium]
MATATGISLEALAAMPHEDGVRYELDRGELVTMAPVHFLHTRIQHTLRDAIRDYIRGRALGEVFLEPGFVLSEDPPTLREPDVAFLATDLLEKEPAEAFFRGAPTIAMEVVSPSESASELELKVRQYLAAGTKAVVTVYPRTRTVWVYRPDGTSRCLEEGSTLDFPDILGEWALPVADIFPR